MYKLFIVDDNPYTRNDLLDLLDWEVLGIEVTGSFASGVEALNNVEELKPDIVLTDIAMPVMSGIELAQKLKEKYPDIKMVFMSGYNEFDFAKKAVDMGIYGYVLKPIIPDDLKEAMDKLLREYELENFHRREKENMLLQMREMLPIVQEQFFRELLFGNTLDGGSIRDKIDYLKLDIPENCMIRVMLLTVDDTDGQHSASAADTCLLSYKVRNIINSASSVSQKVFVVQISGNHYAIAVFEHLSGSEGRNEMTSRWGLASKEKIMNIAADINIDVSRKLGLSAVLGVSKASSYFADMPELYRQAHSAVNTVLDNGSNPIILYEEVEAVDDALDDKMSLETIYKDVKALISLGSEKDIRTFTNKYLDYEELTLTRGYVKSLTFFIVNAAAIVLMESGHSFKDLFGDDMLVWKKLSKFETILDIKQWISNLFKTIREYLTDRNGDRNADRNVKVVDTIKEVIRNRYHEQLTVQDISTSIYLSAGYANSLFKKETDMTIFDYLTQYRIEMAKKMLLDPESKVTVVAEKVGYISKAYFCLSFKKHVGMSPAEYRNKAVL